MSSDSFDADRRRNETLNLTEFEKVTATFADFHREFASLFGRKEAIQRSEQYLRGLLVQQTDRRNAENISEAVEDATPRALQRFLTESPWPDEPVIHRLQEHVGRLLNSPDGVFVLDETGFPKKGKKSVGVTRQYCGTLGKVANCQLGVFLAYVSEQGHALIDKRLYLPKEWTSNPERCREAGVPEKVGYQSTAELGLSMLGQVRAQGHLAGQWVTGDEAYGKVPTLRDDLDNEGWLYVLEVPCSQPVFSQPAKTEVPAWSGHGPHPTKQRLVEGEPGPQAVEVVAASLTEADWQLLTVAEGAQGPRTYLFAAQRVWESRDGLPGRECWLVLRRNPDGSEPKYYLSNAPADTPLLILGQVGAKRWPVETEFQTEKGETGLDEYEVRSWPGWHHHITLSLLAGAFLLSLQQDWGKKYAPGDSAADQSRAARAVATASLDSRGVGALAGRHSIAKRTIQAVPC
jgi:SRSO17 transposase